jgi:signal transduction histidine kinase
VRQPARWWLRAWGALLALLLAALLPAGRAQATVPLELARAEFISVDSDRPPLADAPGWMMLDLPHVWTHAQQGARGGWYRLRWRTPQPGSDTTAQVLYAPQVHVNAAFWLDGHYLGDGGRLADPMSFHWNQPHLLRLPPALAGQARELLLHVRVAGGFGLLAPLYVGDESELRPRFELRRYWQAEVHGMLALLLLAIATLAAGIWALRRQEASYLWLALSCLAWAVFAFFLYGRDFWVDPLWMQWLAQNGAVWWTTGLAHYVHRLTWGARPRLERVLVTLTLGFGTAGLALGPLDRVHVFSAAHVFALITVAYLLRQSWRHARAQRAASSWGLALACGLLLLAGIHDVVLTMPVAWSSLDFVRKLQAWRFYLTPFGAPAASLVLAVFLARRFAQSLNQFEALNAELERRVEDSRHQLDRTYEERRVLERAHAAAQERERIVREMHDGIGSQLMTALRGVERGAFGPQRLAELLQECLDDLRLLLDASAGARSLQPALVAWRNRWEPRLDALGLSLHWRVDDGVASLGLPTDVVLQLMRILQEAVSNVLKHAQAREVTVELRVDAPAAATATDGPGQGAAVRRLSLRISDDGCGLPVSPDPGAHRSGQHGMRSMRSRAEAIGASIEWRVGEQGGTEVCLGLALPPSEAVAPSPSGVVP